MNPNQIVIGSEAVGLGSNTAVLGNDSITTTALKGNVGIGTTEPTQNLDVTGSLRVRGAYYDSNNSPGTSGQFMSSTVTGTDWVAAPSGVTINNNTNNYLMTGTGTANTINGEANLLFDGSGLSINGYLNVKNNEYASTSAFGTEIMVYLNPEEASQVFTLPAWVQDRIYIVHNIGSFSADLDGNGSNTLNAGAGNVAVGTSEIVLVHAKNSNDWFVTRIA